MTEAATTKPKKKSLMARIPANFVAAVLKGHSGLGIAFAAVIYLVCLSGSLTVFYSDLMIWENAGAPHVEEIAPDALQHAVEQAAEQIDGVPEHIRVLMPTEMAPTVRVSADNGAAGDEGSWFANADGELAGPITYHISAFIYALHAYLHLPAAWGAFIVGMTGVALLSSLFSGILAHPRIFRDAFHLRIGGSKRLQEADLHNRISVWALPFHFIVSLTGAFLGLVTITVGVLGMAMFNGDTNKIYELFLAPELPDNPAPAEFINTEPMFAKLPDAGEIEGITLEHPFEQGGHVTFQLKDPTLLAGDSTISFDRSGTQLFSQTPEDRNLGEQVLGAIAPLHFGWFGGAIVRVVYGILGLGLTYLAVGGINIWLARRRDKGRPAPGWESVWASVVWGQPVALSACTALAVMAKSLDQSVFLPFWGAISIAMLIAAKFLPASAIARSGKAIAGVILLVVSLWHMGFQAISANHGAVWAVDLTLLAMGALFCFLAARKTTSEEQTDTNPVLS